MNEKIYFCGKLKNLPFVTMANEVSIAAPNMHFRRTPSEYILYFISSGVMCIIEDNMKYILYPGDILLLDPSRFHYGVEINSPVCYSYIHFYWNGFEEKSLSDDLFTSEQIERRISSFTLQDDQGKKNEELLIPKYCHIELPDYRRIDSLVKELRISFHQKYEYKQTVSGCLLLNLLIEINRTLTGYLFNSCDKQHQMSLSIMVYLQQHCSDKITSEQIADYFHCNYDHLNRRFKQFTGMTIFHFLNQYRIEESKIMIRSGIYNMSQIAEKLGFCNEFYFSRVFKRFEKLSPLEYKRDSEQL